MTTTTTEEILIGRQTSGPTGETTQSLRDPRPVDQPNDEDDMLGSESPWDPATMKSDARGPDHDYLAFPDDEGTDDDGPNPDNDNTEPVDDSDSDSGDHGYDGDDSAEDDASGGITGPLVGVRLECRILKSRSGCSGLANMAPVWVQRCKESVTLRRTKQAKLQINGWAG